MKRKIAETAQRLFQDEGYATVSMRRLAKEVGCSPMTLYKYYDGKIAVLQTLWTVIFRALFSKINDKLEPISDPVDRLRLFCQEYVGYWIQHPEHYRIVFMAEGVTQAEVSIFVDNTEVATGFRYLSEILADAVGDPGSDASAKLTGDLLVGALHGIAHNCITISGYNWSEKDDLIDFLIEKLL